jgi:hypothetical protein
MSSLQLKQQLKLSPEQMRTVEASAIAASFYAKAFNLNLPCSMSTANVPNPTGGKTIGWIYEVGPGHDPEFTQIFGKPPTAFGPLGSTKTDIAAVTKPQEFVAEVGTLQYRYVPQFRDINAMVHLKKSAATWLISWIRKWLNMNHRRFLIELSSPAV